MVDSAAGPESFDTAWGPFGRTVAVVSAALVALAGVIAHVPVWLSSLRGLATLFAVLLLVRAAGFVAAAVHRAGVDGRGAKAPRTGREEPR